MTVSVLLPLTASSVQMKSSDNKPEEVEDTPDLTPALIGQDTEKYLRITPVRPETSG